LAPVDLLMHLRKLPIRAFNERSAN
jgi:hypothetical protein